MKGLVTLVGALCWWGTWGPGPGAPLNPALLLDIYCKLHLVTLICVVTARKLSV